MKKFKLTISGMHCGSCAGNIERSVRSVKSVKNVTVSAVTNTAFVEADDGVRPSEIEKAVARPGYKAVKIELR